MRSYEKTHPWIDFTFNISLVSPRLWMLIGEAQSKCEHIAGVPLRPSTAQELHNLYLAKGALGTTAIEGNTLSEEEALGQIAGRSQLPPSKEYLGQEIRNIADACDAIAERLFSGGSTDLSVAEIKDYNRIVLKNLPREESIVPGMIRRFAVGVTGVRYKGVPAEDCHYLLERLCTWLNNDFRPQDKDSVIAFALLKAVIAHLYIAWIHPFADGNGRTARLVEFKILLSSGVPTPAAHLLSNFYNETRQEYYRQLVRTSESGGNILCFTEYAVRGFVDGLKVQLQTIRSQQWDVAWRNYIHEKFKDKDKSSDIRRRHLALDICTMPNPVPLTKLRDISPRVAAHYARVQARTMVRDVIALAEMELVEITVDGVQAKRDKILSFLPLRRRPSVQSELPL